jgi:hypothetical protein
MRGRAVALVALALEAGAVRPASAADAFLCYGTARAASVAFAGVDALDVVDRFEMGALTVRRRQQLCTPADTGAGVEDPTIHLERYAARGTDAAPHVRRLGLRVRSVLGELHVDTVRAVGLMVPSAVDPATPPAPPDPAAHAVDRYKCYAVRRTPGTARLPANLQVTVDEALGGHRTLHVGRLRYLCTPADVAGGGMKQPTPALACHGVARGPGAPRHTGVGLQVANELETAGLATVREATLCLPALADDGRCNGAEALCARTYDAVAYPTTHNAMSNADEGWAGPNQQHGIARQLADGVRGLMLDTYYFEGTTQLCHSLCTLGKEPLVSGLAKIRTFLERHPTEVVSIIFESYISPADTAAAFAAAGLEGYLHAQAPAAPWPTLGELVDTGRRLLVFTDDGGPGRPPWYHYVWDHAWETHYSFARPEDMSCTINRGNAANPLFILNHFLTQIFGNPALAEQVNHDPFFVDRAEQCRDLSGRLPNFVTVDFYDIGNLFSVVDRLNGF